MPTEPRLLNMAQCAARPGIIRARPGCRILRTCANPSRHQWPPLRRPRRPGLWLNADEPAARLQPSEEPSAPPMGGFPYLRRSSARTPGAGCCSGFTGDAVGSALYCCRRHPAIVRSGLHGCGNGKFCPAAAHGDALADCCAAAHGDHHSGCCASVASGGAVAGDRARAYRGRWNAAAGCSAG